MTVKAPLMRPDAPSPEIARPTMRITDEVALPHMTEPISKTERKTKKVH